MRHWATHFESLFAARSDPWQFKSRWYEQRKRALTLACLPAAHDASAHEPGCANGELSAALAPRCDRLLASDGSATAVAIARERLRLHPNVRVMQAWIPRHWPAQTFDLIVISEVAYYLTGDDLAVLAAQAVASLRPGGTVLACHWRHPIEGCAFGGDEVHRRLCASLGLPPLSQLVEPDFRLDVWCEDARSVAQREGLVVSS